VTLAETLNAHRVEPQVEKGVVTLVSEDLWVADFLEDESYLDRPHSDEPYQPYVVKDGEVARYDPNENEWVETR
jgi:hypothetical protein